MYSYQDRIRAVELYIKLGKRVRVTIRQLGCPTKNALKGWFREYERSLDLPKGYLRPKPKYSQGQKETAVRRCAPADPAHAAEPAHALHQPGAEERGGGWPGRHEGNC